jgi:uncharacterized protein
MTPDTPRKHYWIWLLWLAAFYSVWLALIISGDHWHTLRDHWGIAAAMAAGSYVAGSTPMGGGTIGFPILVLLFDQAATLGRDFSFAVQSIGMVSAAIFILCRRQPVAWPVLAPCILGSLIGTPLGILFIAPLVSPLAIKLLFAVIWASFGVLHLYRTRELATAHPEAPHSGREDAVLGFVIGIAAGASIAAVTGVGIDMLLYIALVLLRRTDLRIAIPASVIVMGATSLIGIATKAMFTGVQPGVYENWLAAAPIVILGAPLGVFIVNRVGRAPTLYFVAVLCLLQFAWTIRNEWAAIGPGGMLLAVAAVAAFVAGFEWLYRAGHAACERKLETRRIATSEAVPVSPG